MKRHLAVAAALVCTSAGAWAVLQITSVSSTVTNERAFVYRVPDNATSTDFSNMAVNSLSGSSLPTSLVDVEFKGEVKAVLTGLHLSPTGERQVVITVVDETVDMVEARVVLNDTQVGFASRANGGIVDRTGKAIATLSILVPPQPPYSVEVRWLASNGDVQTSRVDL